MVLCIAALAQDFLQRFANDPIWSGAVRESPAAVIFGARSGADQTYSPFIQYAALFSNSATQTAFAYSSDDE